MSLTAPTSTAISADLVSKAESYARASMSVSTMRAYTSAWRTFSSWCRTSGLDPLPVAPEVVVLYVTHRADTGMKASTISSAVVFFEFSRCKRML